MTVNSEVHSREAFEHAGIEFCGLIDNILGQCGNRRFFGSCVTGGLEPGVVPGLQIVHADGFFGELDDLALRVGLRIPPTVFIQGSE